MSAGASNFAWLILDKGVRLMMSLVVGFIVARHLGPERFGLLNYAFAVVYLLMPVVELGVESILRRRLINAPENASRLLATVNRMRLACGLFVYACLAFIVIFVSGDSGAGRLMLIAGVGLLQPAWSVADGWLQATLRAKVVVTMNCVALIVSAVVRIGLVCLDADLTAFVWVMVLESVCVCVLLWYGARRAGMPRLVSGDFWVEARDLMKDAWPLLVSALTVSLYLRADVVMLKAFSDEHETGIYSAAVKISELWYFVPTALASSLLPWLLRKKQSGREAYAAAIQRYYNISALAGYLLAGFTVVLARPLIAFAYGAEFSGAAAVLNVHAWGAVWVFLGVARSQFLINENRTVFSMLTTGLGACVNLALNGWWIPRYGAMGAAWATLIAYGVAGWGASWLHPEVRANAWMQTKALLTPWRVFGRSGW